MADQQMHATGNRCDKLHPDLPPGSGVVRCRHGKIGTTQYAVAEAVNTLSPDEGIWIYSDVPSRNVGYSLVCMVNYDKIKQEIKDGLFNLFWMQLGMGLKPLHYVMRCKSGHIIGVDHSEESLETAMEHSIRQGNMRLIRNGTILNGRIAINEDLN
jgi:hypothetical protein